MITEARLFTMRGYASMVYVVVACPCVCLSVTCQYSITPLDSPGTLVF